MICRWRWFIHPETAISINRNGSIPVCIFKAHYRNRGAAVPNHRIFMQIQFSGHTRSLFMEVIKHNICPKGNRRKNGGDIGVAYYILAYYIRTEQWHKKRKMALWPL